VWTSAAPGQEGPGLTGWVARGLLNGRGRRDGGGHGVDVGEALAVGRREEEGDRQREAGDDVVGLDAGHGGSWVWKC